MATKLDAKSIADAIHARCKAAEDDAIVASHADSDPERDPIIAEVRFNILVDEIAKAQHAAGMVAGK